MMGLVMTNCGGDAPCESEPCNIDTCVIYDSPYGPAACTQDAFFAVCPPCCVPPPMWSLYETTETGTSSYCVPYAALVTPPADADN